MFRRAWLERGFATPGFYELHYCFCFVGITKSSRTKTRIKSLTKRYVSTRRYIVLLLQFYLDVTYRRTGGTLTTTALDDVISILDVVFFVDGLVWSFGIATSTQCSTTTILQTHH
jgi:hypothetical protein